MKILKYTPIVLALLANIALADEAQIACDLEKFRSEVQALVLESPTAFGAVGDSATSEKNITMGVAQSLSGRRQAALIRQAAEAKCDSIRASVQLDSYSQWAQLQVQRSGAIEELQIIERALIMAKDNISQLEPQLTARTITLGDHAQAVNALAEIEKRQDLLIKTLAVASVTPPETNVMTLIESLQVREAQAAELEARAQAETGWDTVVSAGVRQPMSGNQGTQPFATIGFKWSFGYSAARDAARNVGVQTGELLRVQQNGYTQTVIRQRETLQQLIKAETLEMNSIRWHMGNLRQTRVSVQGIDTALAQNTLRSVNLQLSVMEAQLAGTLTRLDGYKNLLLTLL
jgi:hypothetical protein